MTSGPLLENYSSLVDTFLEFLNVAIHLILYERDIYPQRSFLKARKYNYPVRQNRHPAVCKFIDDAISAVRAQLMKVGSRFPSLNLIFLLNIIKFPCHICCSELIVPVRRLISLSSPNLAIPNPTRALRLQHKLFPHSRP